MSLPRHQDAIAAIATAPGRGSVGIIRISGRNLGPLIQIICGRELKAREATYLPFLDDSGASLDEGLAIFFPAPRSYTGEDVLELQAHGGPVVLQLLLTRCFTASQKHEADTSPVQQQSSGLRMALPGEFTERAFLNDKIDLTQAEAIADLIDAGTEAAARSAARSLSGAFSSEIYGLRDALIHLRMLVEATLDFPEEEVGFLRKADAQGQLSRLQTTLDSIMMRTKQGALLREGVKVVIAGQPNAGKSSLLNALAGAELAIVTSVAGTTRDKVQQTIQIEGIPVHVIDTAGLRKSNDEVEKIGIERAWDAISTADAVLFLHDLTRVDSSDYVEDDNAISRALQIKLPSKIPVIDVWNKADTFTSTSTLMQKDGLVLSAKTGFGLEALRLKLLEVAGWQPGTEGIFSARERHIHSLKRVQLHLLTAATHLDSRAQSLDLLAEELRLGQNALSEVTGEFNSDDLLGVIFSSFCIGK